MKINSRIFFQIRDSKSETEFFRLLYVSSFGVEIWALNLGFVQRPSSMLDAISTYGYHNIIDFNKKIFVQRV